MTKENRTLNFDLAKKCLSEFLRNHRGDAALRQVPLGEESLEGINKQEREDLWFLGEWVLQGNPSYFEAYWDYDYTETESIRLIVNIESKGNNYVVVDWRVEETF